MKISVVIAYHNRRRQFWNTLESIRHSKFNSDLEIVVVNDASVPEHAIDDFPEKFSDLNLKLFNIKPDMKWWVNPCIPNNIAISLATGDVVVLQNPECFHMGDVLKFVEENLRVGIYIVFGCYAIGPSRTNLINSIDFSSDKYIKEAQAILNPMSNMHVSKAPIDRWYQHPIYNPSGLNFCSAIIMEDLNDLGGFDERFAEGIAKDDIEFKLRIHRKGMKVTLLAEPFVVHQWHTPSNYGDKGRFDNNTRLLEVLKNIDGYKVNNKFTNKLRCGLFGV